MPKVKAKRQSVSLDMTAMCDVAFLLLTFFMLTAKFRPEEAVTITPPTSISEKPLNTKDGVLSVNVSNDGKVFIATEDMNTRAFMLERMANRFGVTVTPEMQANFLASEVIGFPAGALNQVLQVKPAEAKEKGFLMGVPTDSTNNELGFWIGYAKLSNPAIKIAIKGDANSNYKTFADIVATLQGQNINVFQLVTSPENKPQ
jgi:biopolymer transport protein ExbD